MLIALVGATAASAQDASAWNGDQRSAVRLIGGEPRSENGATVLHAGIEIKLAPGWKTYWRYPGDSGVPPRFDFSASENTRSVDVQWPAPQRFVDEDGNSIGYKDEVVLPLHIVPQDAGKPVMLRLKVDYAICEKLCVPADATAELKLPGSSSSNEALLAAAEARVPKSIPAPTAPAPAAGAAGLAIRAVRREDATPHPRIIVDVAAPDSQPVELFAEGPTADWALPLPQPVPGAPPGTRRFAFDLDGAPPGAKPDEAALRLTAVAGSSAIEVVTRPEAGSTK